jgi:predicted metal-dependent peptidase
MREVAPEKIHVAYCDTRVTGLLELEPGDAPVFKPAGGGGTDFRPVFEKVAEEGLEPACLIFMTDCMGTFPEEPPPYPVLWLSTIRPEELSEGYTPPFGELLYLDLSESGRCA